MPPEVFVVKLVAIGTVTGLAYGVLHLIGGYLKRPTSEEHEERSHLLAQQSEEIHHLQHRCEELERRLEYAERYLLGKTYRPVITPSEGT